ncbi:hypothetical protein MNBD_GAMMA16-1199 [hydrothermal vent metagenome]|uniref:Membrane protein involved in colicin uptake n=1 Tax=hydrothermal vent metagenome TaxID=652676 RepID=A0A3B0ZQK6_9ZZZZ
MCIELKVSTSSAGVDSFAGKRLDLRRKKIWELEHRFHCAVAGTCFTLAEMRRFCRKAQVETKGAVSDYELHISFVDILGDAQAARPAAKYLDRKYKTSIQNFEHADNLHELTLLWNEAVCQGEIAAAFWSVLTHPRVTEDFLFGVFGEVHMLSHLSGASVRLDMQALIQLRKRLPKLEKEISRSRAALLSRTRQKDEIITALNKRLSEALQSENKLRKVEERINFLESGDRLRYLNFQLDERLSDLEQAKIRAERAEAEAKKYKALAKAINVKSTQTENQLVVLSAEQHALEIALEGALSTQHVAAEKNDARQQKIDLFGHCILYVGGRNRLCAHFRTLVEQQNGRFIHHDGGREESPHRLDSLLSQVDAVLCPLDCVSHDAVHRIKRDCKRYGKHLTLLSQSSLSAFAKGVHEYSKVSAVRH